MTLEAEASAASCGTAADTEATGTEISLSTIFSKVSKSFLPSAPGLEPGDVSSLLSTGDGLVGDGYRFLVDVLRVDCCFLLLLRCVEREVFALPLFEAEDSDVFCCNSSKAEEADVGTGRLTFVNVCSNDTTRNKCLGGPTLT